MYKIKELATLFGITTQAIRYYEKEGILTPSKRDDVSGYRYYSNYEVNQLAQILQLRELGFHIGQIRNFFNHEFDKKEKVKELKRIIDICNYQIMVLESDDNDFSMIHTKMTESMNVVKRTMDMGNPIDVLNVYGEMVEYIDKNHLSSTNPQGVYISFSKDIKANKEMIDIMLSVEKQMDGITIPIEKRKVAHACYAGSLYELNDNLVKFQKAVMMAGYIPNGNVIQRYLSPCNPISYYAVIEFQIPIQ